MMVGDGLSLNGGLVGDATNPQWLTLNIFAGSLTLNNGASIFGYVTARGDIDDQWNCKVNGGAAADGLTINSQGRLQLNTNGN